MNEHSSATVARPPHHEARPRPAAGDLAGAASRPRAQQARLTVAGMDCAECAHAIEHVLSRVDGIASVAVDYPTGTLTVEFHPDRLTLRTVAHRVEGLGYVVQEFGSLRRRIEAHRELVMALSAGALGIVAWGVLSQGAAPVSELRLPSSPRGVVGLSLAAAAYLLAGLPVLGATLRQLRRGHLDVDLLMVLAALGTIVIGEPLEGLVLLVLFGVGHGLEHAARHRATDAVRALAAMTPRTARIVRDGQERERPVEEVRRGDTVVVRAGERIPVDGQVREGSSWVDQSAVTGEPLPVARGPGDPLFAGTLNGDGTLWVEATHLSSESTLARMGRLVEESRRTGSPAQQTAQRVARLLVPVALGLDLVVMVVPPLVGWLDWRSAFYRAMVLLVAASPCALAVGAPVAVVSGLARAARLGLLVKSGAHLEALGDIRAVAFDKTGTLTEGRAVVDRVTTALPGKGPDELLRLAAAVEQLSTHPLARPVVVAARQRSLSLPNAAGVVTVRGQGVEGEVEGRRVRVGTASFAGVSEAVATGHLDLAPHGSSAGGDAAHTPLFVSVDGRAAGVLWVADPLRAEAAQAIQALRAVGVEHTLLLSGDRRAAAEAVARRIGIDEVMAPLLPEEKVAAVARAGERHGGVAMVGDGVNDGPALAAATVGIAMGAAGSDVALEAAPVALLGSDLRRLAEAVALGRAVRRIVRQNLVMAIGVIVALSAVAVSGQAGIPWAVALHEGSTLLVALNGLRLLTWRPGHATARAAVSSP